MIQSGVALFGYLNTRGWNLSTGSGHRTFQPPHIRFDRPFTTPPTIALSLAGIDSLHSANLRVELQLINVEPDKCKITIITWDNSILYQVWVNWIAYD